jgi:16S rRNA (cytosine1402-N4)-methyltransferase
VSALLDIDIVADGHRPVLLEAAVAGLLPRPGGRYLDGTFGGGGHTRALLAATAPDGIVLALDADTEAVERALALQGQPGVGGRLVAVHANFADLAAVARERGLAPLDGVLLDLGVSSFQLDQPERGFAFRHEGPLDMRFDNASGAPASDLVNTLPERELADLIWRFGEEPGSRRIARAIVQERQRAPIETTRHLAAIIWRAMGDADVSSAADCDESRTGGAGRRACRRSRRARARGATGGDRVPFP